MDGPPNELWPSSDKNDPTAGLLANSQGVAKGFARVDWVARPTARAIWVHAPISAVRQSSPGGRIGSAVAIHSARAQGRGGSCVAPDLGAAASGCQPIREERCKPRNMGGA